MTFPWMSWMIEEIQFDLKLMGEDGFADGPAD